MGNNGRDATKSQKRAIRKVLDGTTTSTTPTTGNHPSGTTAPGLRLPPVPYGSKLDWDEVFPGSQEEDRDIWLELGFGRGENLQALLESKLSEESTTVRGNHPTEGGNDGAAATADVWNAGRKKFYLVGAEVSGVGIGCLCKRIEQQQQQKQKLQRQHQETDDPGFVLYRPNMDPYSSQSGEQGHHDGEGANGGSDNSNTRGDRGNDFGRNAAPAFDGSYYGDRLRIHAGDGYKLLPKLPDDSLSAILVTFPDPFPKDTDVNYRLIQHQTLIECHRILRKQICHTESSSSSSSSSSNNNNNNNNNKTRGGRLFLATDHDGYHEWCHRTMCEVNRTAARQHEEDPSSSAPMLFEPEEPCPDRMEWLPAVSRYEQKGWDEGRSTKLSCWTAIE